MQAFKYPLKPGYFRELSRFQLAPSAKPRHIWTPTSTRPDPQKTPPGYSSLQVPKCHFILFFSSLPGFPPTFPIRARNIADNSNNLPALSLFDRITSCKINEISVVYNSSSKIIIHFGQMAVCKTSLPYFESLSFIPFKNESWLWVFKWKQIRGLSDAFCCVLYSQSSREESLPCG